MRWIIRRVRPLVLLVALAMVVACGGRSGDAGDGGTGGLDLVQPGRLTVCSDIPYAPFEYREGEGFTGFDIELMRAIAEQRGLELEVRDVKFAPLQSGAALNARRCDVAASAMTISEEREQNLDFSDPYYRAQQSLMVAADSDIRTLADTAGRVIGVQAATTGATYAEEQAPGEATIRRFDDAGTLFTAFQAGQVEAVLQDLPVNAEYAREHEEAEIVESYETDEQYGFAVREEGSEALLRAINEALAELRTDGTYDELFERFFFIR